MANINETLGTDLAALAKLLQSKGRGKDTVLAHITPKEAALLKRRGGRGSRNPDTGLLEYDDGEGFDAYAGGSADQISAQNAANQTPAAPVSPVYDVIQPSGKTTQIDTTTGRGAQYGGEYQTGSATNNQIADTQAAEDLAAGKAYGVGTVPTGQALPTSGTAYAPTQLTPLQLGQTAVGESPYAPQEPTPGAPGATQPPKSFGDRALAALTDPSNLAKLGLTGALGLYGASQARKGGSQIQSAQNQQQALATPYQSQGQQLISQAQQGQLTPGSQQAYNAAKAQLAQAQANRGGVGAQQASNQLAQVYQNLLDNQYNYGLKVMNIGDNIAMGAIKTGLQLDQQLNQATTNFYSQLANYVSSGNIGQQQPIQTQVKA